MNLCNCMYFELVHNNNNFASPSSGGCLSTLSTPRSPLDRNDPLRLYLLSRLHFPSSRHLIISRSPLMHSKWKGVSPASFTATVCEGQGQKLTIRRIVQHSMNQVYSCNHVIWNAMLHNMQIEITL